MTFEIFTPLKYIDISPFMINGQWDGVNWITKTKINFSVDLVQYEIPAGFVTDFGSIPRIARVSVDRMGKSLVGFIIHDWAYVKAPPFSRKTADKLLYEIGRLYHEGWYTAQKIYRSVRAFGWMASNSDNRYEDISIDSVIYVLQSNYKAFEKWVDETNNKNILSLLESIKNNA